MQFSSLQIVTLPDGFAQQLGFLPLLVLVPPTYVVAPSVVGPSRAARSRAVMTAPASPLAPPAATSPTDVAMLATWPATVAQRYLASNARYLRGEVVAPMPPASAASPTDVASLVQVVARAPGRMRAPHRAPSLVEPFAPTSVVPAYGPSGPTFVVAMEAGSKVTLEWATDVIKVWDGTEYRAAGVPGPRQTFSATAQLVDGDQRDVRSSIVASAASGSPFLLGLTYEEVTIVAASPGTIANVNDTTGLDWVRPGQRVIGVGNDGTTVTAVVQSSTTTTIALDTPLGASLSGPGAPGARLMPLVAVYLSPQQAFARYPVGAETWSIVARAALFGYVGSDAMGAGATLTTFNDPALGPTPVWDRGLVSSSDAPIGDSVQTLADLIDLGGVPGSKGSAPRPDYGRAVKLVSSSTADFQWLKLFLETSDGPQRTWFASSGRADVVVTGVPVGSTIKVLKGTGSGDYTRFFLSGVGTRLALTMTDGTAQYVAATSAVDNGDGTISIGLTAAPSGTIARASFLELCRFEDDAMDVVWSGGSGDDGWVFTFDVLARAVQQ